MDKVQQPQWWRMLRAHLSYKNATLSVCLLNIITAFLLLRGFFFPPSSSIRGTTALYTHLKESEDIRRAMVPVDLIRRVREIEEEASVDSEADQPKDVKQTAAVGVISRLNNFRSNSDAGSLKAIEEWRRRKMERGRQRTSGKNGTAT